MHLFLFYFSHHLVGWSDLGEKHGLVGRSRAKPRYWSQVFPKVPTPSAWELIVRLHPHVKEEVQVGRLAQCIIFLARLGGYLLLGA